VTGGARSLGAVLYSSPAAVVPGTRSSCHCRLPTLGCCARENVRRVHNSHDNVPSLHLPGRHPPGRRGAGAEQAPSPTTCRCVHRQGAPCQGLRLGLRQHGRRSLRCPQSGPWWLAECRIPAPRHEVLQAFCTEVLVAPAQACPFPPLRCSVWAPRLWGPSLQHIRGEGARDELAQ